MQLQGEPTATALAPANSAGASLPAGEVKKQGESDVVRRHKEWSIHMIDATIAALPREQFEAGAGKSAASAPALDETAAAALALDADETAELVKQTFGIFW